MNQCSQCRYWVKIESEILSGSGHSQGECRHSPPLALLTPRGPMTLYPQTVDVFPACGQFESTGIIANGELPLLAVPPVPHDVG